VLDIDRDSTSSSIRGSSGLRLNEPRLIAVTVAGQVANALVRGSPYRIGRDGVPRVVPGSGGVVLNLRVGDRAVGLAGDHVEPAVAMRNNDRESVGPAGSANRALLAYACVGNRAQVTTGPAAGALGRVTGKHGGINHVLVDFPPAVLRRLRIGDRIQVTAYGQGLELLDFPGVRAINLAPQLLRRWGVRPHARHLHVPVTHLIPAGIMGSGLGRSDSVLGDTDIQLSDPGIVRRFRLHSLRVGDLVAVCPLDYRFGPSFNGNALTVGVVVHADSQIAGHGPGVTPLLVSTDGSIRPTFCPGANIARYLGLRRRIAAVPPPRAGELGAWNAAAPCTTSLCAHTNCRRH
jgi:hypothetical protein